MKSRDGSPTANENDDVVGEVVPAKVTRASSFTGAPSAAEAGTVTLKVFDTVWPTSMLP